MRHTHSCAATTSEVPTPLTRGFSFSVLSNHTMTTSAPDSFNMDDLSKLLETAQSEEELHAADNSDKELTPEFIEGIASECLDLATEKCKDPLVHKVMAMMIINNMISWHRHVALRQLEEENEASMGAWMRDAGKFQACMDILDVHCNWS